MRPNKHPWLGFWFAVAITLTSLWICLEAII